MAGIKDIKDFTKFPSLSDNDYLLGTKTDLGGTDAGITVADFKKLVAQDVKPTIKNGYWWVNGVNTGELATGRTPQFRYTANGMEMKYDNEDDTAFRVIIPIEDLLFTFDDLTPEQVELLKLKFSDLTEAEKNELRGKAFTYADFTPDQLADLRLTWDKLTPGQKKELQGERGYSAFEVWEQQEGNTGKTVEDYLSWLRLPATSVALAIRKEMDQIAEEAEEVIRETNTAGEKADKAAVRANNAAEAAEGIVDGIVPTKTSDLENDSGFITKAVDDLANYYLKSEVYTREEVLNLISQMKSVSIQPVEVLPDIGETNIIYFLPKEGTEDDVYDEYIWISDKWERIGSTSVDLTNYYTKLQTFQTFQPRETGKRLMLDEEGEKLQGIEEGANKFRYPDNPQAGQVLTWGETGASWGNSSNGSNPLILGKIYGITSTADQSVLDAVLNGYSIQDLLDAAITSRSIYVQGITFGDYSVVRSIESREEGRIVITFDMFVSTSSPSYKKIEYVAYIRYNDTTKAIIQIFTIGQILGGFENGSATEIPMNCNNVYASINSSTDISPVLTLSLFGELPQGAETTAIIKNTGSSDLVISGILPDTSNSFFNGKSITLCDPLPDVVPQNNYVELNIKYFNNRFYVRVSPIFEE